VEVVMIVGVLVLLVDVFDFGLGVVIEVVVMF